MAVTPLTGASVLVGTAWTGTAPGTAAAPSGTITSTTDLSSYVQSVGWSENVDLQESTSMGSGGYKTNEVGLYGGSVTFNFFQDFAGSALDQIINTSPLSGVGTKFYVDLKPTSSARSATNPSRVAQLILAEFTPVTAKVGELIVVSVTWPINGRWARLTA